LGLLAFVPLDCADFNLASAASAAAERGGLGPEDDVPVLSADPSTLWPPECEPDLEQREPMKVCSRGPKRQAYFKSIFR